MATLTKKIPASNPMDIAEIQKKLSVYAECLVKSLKNKKIQNQNLQMKQKLKF